MCEVSASSGSGLLGRREHVLFTMPDSGAADSETHEPGADADPCDVYCALSDRVLSGA